MAASIDEAKLKDMLKVAMVEALHEQRDLVKDILAEAIEDIALGRAIDEGLQSDSAPRGEVFAVLESGR